MLLKYNRPKRGLTPTICHVEQIDENSFAFVRRIEYYYYMSSSPLYDRIVVDRSTKELKLYSYKNKTDENFGEYSVYKEQVDNSINYDT